LILRKITEIVATRCHILKLKFTKLPEGMAREGRERRGGDLLLRQGGGRVEGKG